MRSNYRTFGIMVKHVALVIVMSTIIAFDAWDSDPSKRRNTIRFKYTIYGYLGIDNY